MTNTSSKTSDERSRIASKTRAVSELQESKSCLETNNNKRIRIARRINNRNKKEPVRRITIAEQKTNNNRNKKEPAQRITIAKQTTNNNLDRKKAIVNNKTIKSAQRISIAKQETNDNRSKKDQRSTIAKRHKPVNKRISTIAKRKTNHYRVARNKPITIAKAHYNRMPKKRQFTIAKRKGYHHRSITDTKHKANDNRNLRSKKAERKAKHNRKTNGKMRIANRNETKMGSRISDF